MHTDIESFVDEVVDTIRRYPYFRRGNGGLIPSLSLADARPGDLETMSIGSAVQLVCEQMDQIDVVEFAGSLVRADSAAKIQLSEFFSEKLNPDQKYDTEAPKRV